MYFAPKPAHAEKLPNGTALSYTSHEYFVLAGISGKETSVIELQTQAARVI
jgi:hypothetical protein